MCHRCNIRNSEENIDSFMFPMQDMERENVVLVFFYFRAWKLKECTFEESVHNEEPFIIIPFIKKHKLMDTKASR